MSSEISLKQPRGLPVLLMAELWERFGFYCIQALLVLYLTQKLGWGDKSAYVLFSAFSALIYATPLIGGYLADRYLGYRQAIYIGTGLYFLGYLGMGFGHWFNLSLAALICGNGFFKPNVSSLLGKLYKPLDPRRDSGFTLFYMGINIGAALAPLLCTYIAVHYGWHYAFWAAALGMIFCFLICLAGFSSRLDGHGLPSVKLGFKLQILLYILIMLAVVSISQLFHHDKLVSNIAIGVELLAFTGIFLLASFEKGGQRRRLIALVILMLFSILFWALYVQAFSSLVLFAQRNLHREILGHIIPAGMFTAISPLLIIILSPALAVLWTRLGQRHSRFNPSTPMKFAWALILMGGGFLMLYVGLMLNSETGVVAIGWLVLCYFMQVLGELGLSPIGLAAVTALAPPRFSGLIMGVWFLSLSAAYALGGKIANLTAISPDILQQNNAVLTAGIYAKNFWHFGVGSLAVGIILIFFTPTLKNMIKAQD